MTVTSDEIRKMRDELAASDPSLTPAQVVQGVRTLVHMRVSEDSPPPYPLPPADKGKTDVDFYEAFKKARTDEEKKKLHDDALQHLAERKAAMNAAVPHEVAIAYHREAPRGVVSPHHYAQYLHGKALWEHADSLVAAAGVM